MSAEPPVGTDVHVAWEDAREANRLNWDDRAPLHEIAYEVERYHADPSYLSVDVREDLPVLLAHLGADSLAGLDLVHLQCHIGTDTVSLARAGARVTGVDLSPASLDAARRLAAATGADVTWVESDVLAARDAVTGDFDVVYTSVGTICWLADLDLWARQVAGLLRPGGVFYLRDGHPMLLALDDTAPDLRVRYRYFGDGRAQTWDDDSTYVGDGRVTHSRTYEWPHPVSEVVGSLLRAGLVLERLDEGKELPWEFSPRMVEVSEGRWAWPGEDRERVPCTLTVVARRP